MFRSELRRVVDGTGSSWSDHNRDTMHEQDGDERVQELIGNEAKARTDLVQGCDLRQVRGWAPA